MVLRTILLGGGSGCTACPVLSGQPPGSRTLWNDLSCSGLCAAHGKNQFAWLTALGRSPTRDRGDRAGKTAMRAG